jgi:hypothetical protein
MSIDLNLLFSLDKAQDLVLEIINKADLGEKIMGFLSCQAIPAPCGEAHNLHPVSLQIGVEPILRTYFCQTYFQGSCLVGEMS